MPWMPCSGRQYMITSNRLVIINYLEENEDSHFLQQMTSFWVKRSCLTCVLCVNMCTLTSHPRSPQSSNPLRHTPTPPNNPPNLPLEGASQCSRQMKSGYILTNMLFFPIFVGQDNMSHESWVRLGLLTYSPRRFTTSILLIQET